MPNNYVKNLLTLLLLFIGSSIFINAVVDPYNLFRLVNIEGFNAAKIEADKLQRLCKAYDVKRLKPETVILGTSRALALRVDHPVLSKGNSYNLALASASTYEIMRYMQHAHAIHPLKQIILGLDFFAFDKGVENNYSDSRLNADEEGKFRRQRLNAYIKDFLPALLSLDAIKASIRTVKRQNEGVKGGHSPHQNKLKNIRKNGGHRKMFLSLERDLMRHGTTSYPDCLDAVPVNSPTLKYDEFQTIIRTAYRDGIDLVMFISPAHARFNEVLCAQGLWVETERWKKNLVALNEEEARKYGKKPFPLWDFSGYNDFTSEPVPAPDDTESLMQWYWETTHYSIELGDLILDRLFNLAKADAPPNSDFGKKIDSKNIDTHLKNTRSARDKYVETHMEDIREITNMIRKP